MLAETRWEETMMKSVLLAGLASACLALPAYAQERMPQIPMDQMSPAQKKVAEAIMTGPRKSISGPFNAWLRSPELADRLQQLGEYIRFKTSLDHRLNEFAILITAQDWGSQYEWYAHYPLALKAGLEPNIAAELAAGKRPTGMKEDEALVYDFSTQLHHKHNVDDATYKAAVSKFGEQGVMDLIAVNGYYDLVSMTLNVAHVRPPESEKVPIAQK
jgi:4-carboxymuconolactone decarboxylase